MSLNAEKTRNIVEAALLSAGQPLSIDRLLTLFLDEYQPSRDELRLALAALKDNCAGRGVELVEVSSGFRYQARQDYAPWVARLWEEKPARYSRALLETLSLIAYRQPITRGEIEDIRGVSVSTTIMKTLLEREWVKVVGYRDVPGKPAMYASTRQFLDYFGLKGLGDLPTLAEIRDIDSINAELDLAEPGSEDAEKEAAPAQKTQLSLDEIVAIKEAEAEQAEALLAAEADGAIAEADDVINDAATSTLTDDENDREHAASVPVEPADIDDTFTEDSAVDSREFVEQGSDVDFAGKRDNAEMASEAAADADVLTDSADSAASDEPLDSEKSPSKHPQETTNG